jgi:UDP-glucose 4-epimerase
MARKIEGSTVVITGGTGSFGSNMARHLPSKKVSEVRIFSRDEAKQDAMRHAIGDNRARSLIAPSFRSLKSQPLLWMSGSRQECLTY